MRALRASVSVAVALGTIMLFLRWYRCQTCFNIESPSLAVMMLSPAAIAAALATVASISLLSCEVVRVDGKPAPIWIRFSLGLEILVNACLAVLL